MKKQKIFLLKCLFSFVFILSAGVSAYSETLSCSVLFQSTRYEMQIEKTRSEITKKFQNFPQNKRLREIIEVDGFGQKIEALVLQAKSFQDLVSFVEFVKSIEGRKFDQFTYSRITSPFGELSLNEAVTHSSFLFKLQSFKNEISPAGKEKIISLIESIPESTFFKYNWREFALSAKLALGEINFLTYLDHIPNYEVVTRWKYKQSGAYFTRFHADYIKKLDSESKAKVYQKLKILYVQLRMKEKEISETDPGLKDEVTLTRRNVELLMWALNDVAVNTLFNELSLNKTITLDMANQLVQNYWAATGFSPGYSFDKIYRLANTLRKKSFGVILRDNPLFASPGDYIEIYGSYPNGKARLTSDLDVHFGPKTNKLFTDTLQFGQFHEDPTFEPNLSKLQIQQADYLNRMLSVSADIVKKELGIPKDMSVEIFELLFEPEPYLYKDGIYNLYNPVSLMVYKDQVTLRVFNGFTNQSVEVNIGQ